MNDEDIDPKEFLKRNNVIYSPVTRQKNELERFCRELTNSLVQDEEITILPDGNDSWYSYNSARIVADKFGGKVAGFYTYEHNNPNAQAVGTDEGIDFAVVGDFIVDWWGSEFEGRPPVYHMVEDAAEVKRLYGDPDRWEYANR